MSTIDAIDAPKAAAAVTSLVAHMLTDVLQQQGQGQGGNQGADASSGVGALLQNIGKQLQEAGNLLGAPQEAQGTDAARPASGAGSANQPDNMMEMLTQLIQQIQQILQQMRQMQLLNAAAQLLNGINDLLQQNGGPGNAGGNDAAGAPSPAGSGAGAPAPSPDAQPQPSAGGRFDSAASTNQAQPTQKDQAMGGQLPGSDPASTDAASGKERATGASGNVYSSEGGDRTPQQIAREYKTEIDRASKASGISPELLAGMIWTESKGQPARPGGGLMQLGGKEFQKYGGGDINNSADNIMAGAMYMKDLKHKFGSTEAALRGYNSGPDSGVDLNNLRATPAGTGDPAYIDKVLDAARASGASS
jgi:hypothetical protein